MKNIYILTFVLLFISCNTKKKISGTYISNRNIGGFFSEKIDFKENDKYTYEFSGDLEFQQASGGYLIKDDILYLKFDKDKLEIDYDNDTLSLDLFYGDYHLYDLQSENGIDYHMKYKIINNKLFVYNLSTGKVVKKFEVRSKNKWKMKKVYLKKLN